MQLAELLGPDGPIARAHPAFEVRPEQLQMMQAVERALAEGRHLLVEAGTGVGKTFAYLLPFIRHAVARERPVAVSTHTINLQEQLLHQDVPFLQATVPWKFTAALGKGRSNYLCRRRFDLAREQLRLDPVERDEMRLLEDWIEQTPEGSRSDLPFEPHESVWSQVSSERDNCMGKRSPHFDECFYQAAMRRLRSASLLVLNHNLTFSDLALREAGVSYLPECEVAVLDEAHTLPEVAHRHFGIELSSTQLRFYLQGLYHPERRKGFLADRGTDAARRAVVDAAVAANGYFDRAAHWLRGNAADGGRVRAIGEIPDSLSGPLQTLADRLEELLVAAPDEAEQFEIQSHWRKASACAAAVEDFSRQEAQESVYWVEEAARARRVTIRASPIDVGPTLRRLVFGRFKTCVLTSATLGIGRNRSLDYAKRALGIEDALELAVGSPFDYQNQAVLYLSRSLPAPGENGYLEALAQAVDRHVRRSRGRAFVLFTNLEHMRRVHELVAPGLEECGVPVLLQGDGLGRHQMIDRFKQQVGSVLFGVDSFWQGVDVPGEALENVIITKMPFPVPNEPLVAAKCEAIEARGGNAFLDFLLPEAIIKLRQGFGRLIRRKTDHGSVAILDSRLLRKRYGRTVLDSLPECPRVVE
ncbi:MAG: ATP-dependent DNA helicase [Planctomycetes bacterium]|nr:ATP-dependent DNA helicase [Planctomycetota bacterium]